MNYLWEMFNHILIDQNRQIEMQLGFKLMFLRIYMFIPQRTHPYCLLNKWVAMKAEGLYIHYPSQKHTVVCIIWQKVYT